nr:hypothetical protein [Bradyrhizobium sp. Cp5.3]
MPSGDKAAETHPDCRRIIQGLEVSEGLVRRGENSRKGYVSLSPAAPEFGRRKLFQSREVLARTMTACLPDLKIRRTVKTRPERKRSARTILSSAG